MITKHVTPETLSKKISGLPVQTLAELDLFVEFLRAREGRPAALQN